MRSEHEVASPKQRLNATPLAADVPHPGCNCGRRRAAPAAPPLLTDDLVIAARDRAREPELPEATLVRALSTPIVSRNLLRTLAIQHSVAANANRIIEPTQMA